ncbi:MAG: MarR family transcriptional regulator [Paenibacillus sp.]|nr:MarR family transcriptional regulator [Paenibacillus sp.]
MDAYADRFHTAMGQLKRKMVQEFTSRLEAGLTYPQFFLLHFIQDKGSCKASELAERMEVKPSAITVMIDRLVNNGYVVRCPDESDRRVYRIELTEKGRQMLDEKNEIRKEIARRYLSKLDAGEAERFLQTLEKLAK